MHWCIVGNVENRRVQSAIYDALQLGLPAPITVSWAELLSTDVQRESSALEKIRNADLVRIDSAGENSCVQNRLLQLGGTDERLAFGEIGLIRQQHNGFVSLLEKLASLNANYINSPIDIKGMFDKWQSHQRFADAKISRPSTFLIPQNSSVHDFVRTRFGSAGRVFIKPQFGSSASGVCAYRWTTTRQQLIAPIELVRKNSQWRLFNSLRIKSYTATADINAIFEHLNPHGLICESWVAKARLPDGNFDLRILVINNEARHTVVRQSHDPMTNLHLGNRRGNLCEVVSRYGEPALIQARNAAENAASCFSHSVYAGVDVLISKSGHPVVCEINAFGDLLPNVLHRNETTYQAILKACCVQSDTV